MRTFIVFKYSIVSLIKLIKIPPLLGRSQSFLSCAKDTNAGGFWKVENCFKTVESCNYKKGAFPPFIGGGLGWGLARKG